jgi:GMP synthase-like glutamine amidotransferase
MSWNDDESAGLPALVLQHRKDTPGGLLTDVLAEQGFRASTVRLDLGEPLPDPGTFKLVVALGCDDVIDADERGLAPAAIDWLHVADRTGTPVLGLGSGAQALAVALGGRVDRAPRSRHGWVWISSSTPGWIADGPWLAWRDEVIRLPPRAKLLAHDPLGPQVFGAGRHLGVQFHPEVTPEIVGAWVGAERTESLDAQGILEQTSREFGYASVAARRLLSTYIHSLARHAA